MSDQPVTQAAFETFQVKLFSRLNGIDHRFDALEKKMDARFDEVAGKIDAIKEGLVRLERRVARS